MIELYYADSGNSLRVVMLLEECGLPYKANKLNLINGDQKAPEFLKINRFGLVPVIEDSDGPEGRPIRLSQSAAIMLYLANKAGKFIPSSEVLKLKIMEWLFVAASDVGPANALMLYMNREVSDLSDSGRLYLANQFIGLLRAVEAHLADSESGYLAGELSVADFALLPPVRIRRKLLEEAGGFTHLFKWADRLMARPAVQRAMSA